MSAGEYVAGLVWIAVVGGAHGRSAWRLRWLLVPRLSTGGGLLATCVLFVLTLTTLGQLLGAVGLLSWWPVLIASVVLAVAVDAIARRSPRRIVATGRSPMGSTGNRLEIVAAVGCLAAVAWQWTTHLADAFDRGMVQADNLWYHGPFMARFLQTGGFGDLGALGYRESRFYPMNSELFHGLMSLPFGRDVAVPLANHLFAALALGAAFVIGRRWGAGALAVLATTIVVSLPLVASTQPGQMYNDVMAAALILAAVALLFEGGLDAACLGVAGAAVGMALSTKLSLVGVAGPLALGVLVVALLARRWPAAITWIAALSLTGTFWFARNWIVHGSPVPYVDIDIGPIEMPALAKASGESLAETLDDFAAVRSFYGDALRISFGRLWFVPVPVAVAGCVVLLARCRDWRFLAAVSALFGVVTFPLLPLTGGLSFGNNLRYGVTTLMLALALSALAAAWWPVARAGLALVCVACIVANLTSAQRGRVEAWPGHPEWGFLAAAAVVAGAWWWWSLDARRRSPPSITPSIPLAVGLTSVVVLAAIGGWYVQRSYLEDRYVDSGLAEDLIYRPFAAVSDSHIDVIAEYGSYVMFGPDLSNDVAVWNDALDVSAPPPADPCRFWRAALEPGPGYVAIGSAWLLRRITPGERAEWFGRDPAVRTIVDDGSASVYYHDRALSPSGC